MAQIYLRKAMGGLVPDTDAACERCGWDKAPIDRHRVEPERGYVPENLKLLCPNCHRLEHMGL